MSYSPLVAQADRGDKPTWAGLKADPAKGKELKKGLDLTRKFLKAEWELAIGKKGASLSKVERARAKWREWLAATGESVGVVFEANPQVTIDMIAEARESILRAVKLKKGQVDVGSKPAPGFPRGDFVYNILVPKSYEAKAAKMQPLVITMHGRAINLRHPALKRNPQERSRIVLWNNWGGSGKDAQQDAVVIAPTGQPDGWVYEDGSEFLRQAIILAAGAACTDYQVDSRRIFVECYGDSIIDAIDLSPFFAGIILRDREDAKEPPIPAEKMAIFENLNGRPLYYIADEAKWKTVGEPMKKALEEIYNRLGKRTNLVIERVKRDANSALKAKPEGIANFLRTRLPDAQRDMSWLFWRPLMTGPMPLLLTRADYDYDETETIAAMPLRDKCGMIKMKASVTTEKVDGKDIPVNIIDMEIYEAEGAQIFLYEPLVDLDLPITVKVNGNVVIDKQKIARNWELFERFCMSRKIFTFPVVAHLEFKFPFKARVEPEKKEEPKDEGPAKDASNEGADGKEAATTDK
ncbi:MAG: hypothetical protein ACYTHK_16120 [Planctomycetota bacterium]